MFPIQSLAIILALVALCTGTTVIPSQRTRELDVCDTLKACYLINIKTRRETILDGFDSFTIDPNNDKGYSIRCDVRGRNVVHFIKFKYDGFEQDEYGFPRYMFGDAGNGLYINKVDYLSSCGRKTLTIEGHIWEKMCFSKTYSINARYPKGKSCPKAPVNAPVNAPVTAPVKAPVPAPAQVNAPVPAQVNAPVSVSVKTPSTVPQPRKGCKAAISSFTLIDAVTHKDIMPLGNFAMKEGISNIRVNIAECVPKIVESVFIELDGQSRCERHAPYALYGDLSNVDISNDKAIYDGEIIGVGAHVLKATPYAGGKCDGLAGATITKTFRVV